MMFSFTQFLSAKFLLLDKSMRENVNSSLCLFAYLLFHLMLLTFSFDACIKLQVLTV